jgi:hypothetical protein
MPQKTVLFLLFLFSTAACRQKNEEKRLAISYPKIPALGIQLDTSFSPAVPVPFDTLYTLDTLWQQNWLQQQIQLSQQQLSVAPSLPTWRVTDRLDGFPQQIGKDF